MIIECLLEIVNTDLDIGDLRKLSIKRYIKEFTEDQFLNLFSTNQIYQ